MAKKAVIVKDADGNIVGKYESIHELSRQMGVLHSSVLYWVRTGYIKNGMTFEFENKEDYTSYTPYPYYKVKPMKDVELDREKFTIIKYEVINKRTSITPCPYKRFPKPMVGSGACQGCGSFRGRNRTTHEVACSRKIT